MNETNRDERTTRENDDGEAKDAKRLFDRGASRRLGTE